MRSNTLAYKKPTAILTGMAFLFSSLLTPLAYAASLNPPITDQPKTGFPIATFGNDGSRNRHGRGYTATIHSKKDQTFTYDAQGVSTAKDVQTHFDRQTVSMSKGGNFFSTDLGKLVKIAVVVAISVIFTPLAGAMVSLATDMLLMDRAGAGPKQMWKMAALTVAVEAATAGMGKGASAKNALGNEAVKKAAQQTVMSQIKNELTKKVAEIALKTAIGFSIMKAGEKIAEAHGGETSAAWLVVLNYFSPQLKASPQGQAGLSTAGTNAFSASNIGVAVAMAGTKLGLIAIEKNNRKPGEESSWLLAALEHSSGMLTTIIGGSLGTSVGYKLGLSKSAGQPDAIPIEAQKGLYRDNQGTSLAGKAQAVLTNFFNQMLGVDLEAGSNAPPMEKASGPRGFGKTVGTALAAPFKAVGGIITGSMKLISQVPIVGPVLQTTTTFAWKVKGFVFGGISTVVSGDFLSPQRFGPDGKFTFDQDPLKVASISINGMGNNERDAELLRNAVAEGFGIADMTYIANGKHWFGLGDTLQVVFHELGAYDKPVLNLVSAIRQGIHEKGEVYVEAHSQGTAIATMAFDLLTVEERGRIHYYGAGGQFFVDAKEWKLASARNVWNKGDVVPTMGNINPLNLVVPSRFSRMFREQEEGGDGRTSWALIDVDRTSDNQPKNRHHFRTYYEADMKVWAAENAADFRQRKMEGQNARQNYFVGDTRVTSGMYAGQQGLEPNLALQPNDRPAIPDKNGVRRAQLQRQQTDSNLVATEQRLPSEGENQTSISDQTLRIDHSRHLASKLGIQSGKGDGGGSQLKFMDPPLRGNHQLQRPAVDRQDRLAVRDDNLRQPEPGATIQTGVRGGDTRQPVGTAKLRAAVAEFLHALAKPFQALLNVFGFAPRQVSPARGETVPLAFEQRTAPRDHSTLSQEKRRLESALTQNETALAGHRQTLRQISLQSSELNSAARKMEKTLTDVGFPGAQAKAIAAMLSETPDAKAPAVRLSLMEKKADAIRQMLSQADVSAETLAKAEMGLYEFRALENHFKQSSEASRQSLSRRQQGIKAIWAGLTEVLAARAEGRPTDRLLNSIKAETGLMKGLRDLLNKGLAPAGVEKAIGGHFRADLQKDRVQERIQVARFQEIHLGRQEMRAALKADAKEFAEGGTKGDFVPDERRTWKHTVGQIGVGFSPAGIAADLRDFEANRERGSKAGMALAAIGFVPIVGDGAKSVIRGLRGDTKALKVASNISDNQIAHLVKKTDGISSEVLEKAGRVDYSRHFDDDLRNFQPGYKLHSGSLSEELILVQFHRGGELGEVRTAKWWTSSVEANSFSTMDDIFEKLSLPPDWGARTMVSVARIPKGVDVTYVVGKAASQESHLTAHVFSGGGIQYRFREFDPSWILETRKIPK